MNTLTYKRILANTIKISYPLYLVREFLKDLEEQELVLIDKRKKEQEGKVDLQKFLSDDERIEYLLREWPSFIKKFEDYEFKRIYRYCHLIKYSSINLNNIEEILSKGGAIKSCDDISLMDALHRVPIEPTYKADDEKIYLKFNVQLDSKIESHDSIKHVILVIIYKNSNIIEIHQDIIKTEYQIADKMYDTYVRSIKGWLAKELDLVSQELDLQSSIKYIKESKQEEVKVTAIRLKKDGMIADLDASSNPKLQLPILDEIKSILSDEIFDRSDDTRTIRDMFNHFIEQTETLSDMPSARLLWLEKQLSVLVYGGEEENELQYLKWSGELKGGEEVVSYVTNYFRQCENELTEIYDN